MQIRFIHPQLTLRVSKINQKTIKLQSMNMLAQVKKVFLHNLEQDPTSIFKREFTVRKLTFTIQHPRTEVTNLIKLRFYHKSSH